MRYYTNYYRNIQMKLFVILVLLATLLNSQIRTISRGSITSFTSLIPSLLSPPNLQKQPIAIILPTPTAYCYQGTINITIEKGSSSNITYYVCFDQIQTCTYLKCFNGWVANYTTSDLITTQGYPNGNETQPVFAFHTNSATDFQIIRSTALSSAFVDIIYIACAGFDPTVVRNANVTDNELPMSPNLPGEIFYPKYTLTDKIEIPNIKKGSTAIINLFFSTLKPKLATLTRNFEFDTVSQLINIRLDIVNIQLASDFIKTSSAQQDTDFIGAVTLNLTKLSSQTYDSTALESKLNQLKGKSFKIDDLLGRTSDKKLDDRNDSIPAVDTITTNQPKTTDIINQLSFDITAQINKFAASSTTSSFSSFAPTPVSINPSLINFAPSTGARLLSSVIQPIFSTQKILYSKTLLGKEIKISILVSADLIDKTTVKIVGTLKFVLFGSSKSITLFDYTRIVGYNWNLNKSFSGIWGFTLYVPLPPPVSFIGLNFGISANYSIDVNLFGNGTFNSTISVYQFKLGAVAGTGITVDGSASLRVAAVEGGVYLKGTLFKVSTDPTLNMSYLLAQKKLAIQVLWNYNVKLFQTEWGFFWRYWKPFSWSKKSIIVSYKINGVDAIYKIMNTTKNYSL